jgi:transcriptional regulator with XRE-family HTH domain
MEVFIMEISDALKRFRSEQRLSQKAVAEALQIKIQAYQKYEYGSVTPSAQVIKDIANAFNMSADYLLGRTDKP